VHEEVSRILVELVGFSIVALVIVINRLLDNLDGFLPNTVSAG
jgi:hypothetical protein